MHLLRVVSSRVSPRAAVLVCLWTFSMVGQVQYDRVPPELLQQRLSFYKGDDSTREVALRRLFLQAGCALANLSEQAVPGQKQPNLICTLPGSTRNTIIVGAHYDHTAAGDGIVDNWSGAALLPSLFQSLARSPRRSTYVFAGFTGGEDGLIGSAFYVKQLSQDQLSTIEAMVNLDTLGLGPTRVWVGRSDPLLVNRLLFVGRTMKFPVGGMNVDGFRYSDEESFIERDVCTVTIHSVTKMNSEVPHSAADSFKAIRFKDYYDTYRLVAVYLSALDTLPGAGRRVCKLKPL